ncbi:hypothetical protein AB4254_11985 [Vibrio breoganii]
MPDSYNKEVLKRFHGKISFVVMEKDSGLDAVLVLHNKGRDRTVVGFVSAHALKDEDVCSVSLSWAHRGFGNVLYAMVMMKLNRDGMSLCCDRDGDLSDDAWSLWDSINTWSGVISNDLKKTNWCEEYLEVDAEMEGMEVSEYIDTLSKSPDTRNAAYTIEADSILNIIEKHPFDDNEVVRMMSESEKLYWRYSGDDIESAVLYDRPWNSGHFDQYARVLKHLEIS